ncbi:MAG TPA: protein usg [Caulobacteraceae bacterium]|nr:protein usg [Caulobacteraceae bacterium]
MTTEEFARQLGGERLTTAEVLYYMPDHPKLLQSFLWQTLDLAPGFPRVHRFLAYWRREIHAVIHSVNVTAAGLVAPARLEIASEFGALQ